MSKKATDLIGYSSRFLIVISPSHTDSNYRKYWNCKCICGSQCVIRGDIIIANTNANCGCKTSELQSRAGIEPNKQSNIARIFRQYKKRGLQSGKGFSLTKEQFIKLISGNCAYCNAPPTNCCKIKTKLQTVELQYNGIDRIDSSLGYSIDNCVSCCIRCNVAKNDMTIEEFLRWIESVYRFSFTMGNK